MENRLVEKLKTQHPGATNVEVVNTPRSTEQSATSDATLEPAETTQKSYAAAVRALVVNSEEGSEIRKIHRPPTTRIPMAPKKKLTTWRLMKNRRTNKTSRPKTVLSSALKPIIRVLNAISPEAAKCLKDLAGALEPIMSILVSMNTGTKLDLCK